MQDGPWCVAKSRRVFFAAGFMPNLGCALGGGSLAGGAESKIYGCVSVQSRRVELPGERRETMVVDRQEVLLCNLCCAAVDAEVKTAMAMLWRGSDRQAERGPNSARMPEWLASVAHRAELVSRSVCSH